MAKKVIGYVKLPDSRRQGHSGAACRPRAWTARREHHGFLQGVQMRKHRPNDQEGLIIPVVITIFKRPF
jgi:hypothetical protein